MHLSGILHGTIYLSGVYLILLNSGVAALSVRNPDICRRSWLVETASVALGSFLFAQPALASAPSSTLTLLDELKTSKEKLEPINGLLQEKEWEKVRAILKVPPVNKLWNLGDSQNIVLKLAKETGNVDLFEVKEDLAYSLQMCDQLTYDNAFVYFQPGDGKFKIKEPQQLAAAAMKQIQQAIDMANE